MVILIFKITVRLSKDTIMYIRLKIFHPNYYKTWFVLLSFEKHVKDKSEEAIRL